MATPNFRLIPRSNAPPTSTVNGRSYTTTPGSLVDVVEPDAQVLGANNCVLPLRWAQVGPTSARPPTYPDGRTIEPGLVYVDTSIAAVICWDGAAWRNLLTGAAV